MVDRKTFGHLSYRVATRRQSFSLPNMISIWLRRLYLRLSYLTVFLRCSRPGMHGRIPFVFQRFSEPVSVIAAVAEQPIDLRYAAQQCSCADVIADLPSSDKQVQWSPLAIANGVEFGVHPAFGPTPLGRLLRNRLPGSGSGVHAPFFNAHAGRCVVGLQIGRVDHDSFFLTVTGSEADHHLRENAPIAPPFPTIV